MKGSIPSVPIDYKRSQVYLSSMSSDKCAQQFSQSLESRSACNGTAFKKSSSQTSFLDSVSQTGNQMRIANRNTQEPRSTDCFTKKPTTPGKQNAVERRLTDISKPVINTQTQIRFSAFLSSFGTQNQKRDSLPGSDVGTVSKSKPKDKKIQQLIESNIPRMTRDKQYYIEKLIECENALRTKDKKLKVIEKNERQLMQTLDKTCASQLMYKTQLQALQRYQTGKIHDTEDLKYKISELEQTLAKNENFWKNRTSSLQSEISNLNIKLSSQTAHSKELELQLKQSISTTNSLLEFKTLYSESKMINAQLEAKNAQLSMKLSTIVKEPRAKASFQSNSQIKLEGLQKKIESLLVENKQLVSAAVALNSLRQKQIESNSLYQKQLQMQIKTLRESLSIKIGDGLESSAKLKQSHDNLKFEHLQLKKFVQSNQTQQTQVLSVLKTNNIKLEIQLKEVKDSANLEKQSSAKIIQALESALDQYKNKCEQYKNIQFISQQKQKSDKQTFSLELRRLQQKIIAKNDQILQLEEEIKNYESLSEFTKNQTKQIQSSAQKWQEQQIIIDELKLENKSLTSQVTLLQSGVQRLEKLTSKLSNFEEQASSNTTIDSLDAFNAINTALDKQYTFWNLLNQPKQETVISPYENPCQQILQTLKIEQIQGWETKLVDAVRQFTEIQTQFEQLTAKFKQKSKYYETRLHVCKEQDERKTLIISDLKANIKLTEKSLNQTSDKLMKCTILLEQSNHKILVGEAKLADAKNQLSGMYSELKAENQSIFQRNQSVEIQLKDLLAKHYQGFYDQIIQRSPQDLLRLDVFLIKAFLSTAIQINHQIKQVNPTSAYMEELLVQRNGALAQIRQYYKQLLEPEIAQMMAYYKPVNQKAMKFQGS